ncbi:50S ribosomal protein L7ae [archaeon]|nr:50S ribosomal protein L7ae [archaeon]|tara:strand:+ start:2266 stop:2613 length:348 start_codon:yes stop_codon:yes gene_type:complete
MAEQADEKVLEAIEVAKNTGKIKKGINEVTKLIERGSAKLVAYAKDVNPPELTMHLEPLCKEKEVVCKAVEKKEDLGSAAGLPVGTSAVVVTEPGEAGKLIDAMTIKPKTEEKTE